MEVTNNFTYEAEIDKLIAPLSLIIFPNVETNKIMTYTNVTDRFDLMKVMMTKLVPYQRLNIRSQTLYRFTETSYRVMDILDKGLSYKRPYDVLRSIHDDGNLERLMI